MVHMKNQNFDFFSMQNFYSISRLGKNDEKFFLKKRLRRWFFA